ncbi:hypothetical protein [Roseivirga sp.]|uniref:hypothetical protein n=1 Tax=Roseivirga sp. TaxID=1964215 RepID=UPI003B8D894A
MIFDNATSLQLLGAVPALLNLEKLDFVNLIHPTSFVTTSVTLAQGNQIEVLSIIAFRNTCGVVRLKHTQIWLLIEIMNLIIEQISFTD